MPAIPCPQCSEPLDGSIQTSRHKNRYHSTPIPVVLPDGSVKTVENLVRGYRCWCGTEIDTREACTKHVHKHTGGDEAVFLQSSKSPAVSHARPVSHYNIQTAAAHPSNRKTTRTQRVAFLPSAMERRVSLSRRMHYPRMRPPAFPSKTGPAWSLGSTTSSQPQCSTPSAWSSTTVCTFSVASSAAATSPAALSPATWRNTLLTLLPPRSLLLLSSVTTKASSIRPR